MTTGLSPIDEITRYRRRAEWISRKAFIHKVELKLKELGVFNQVVDSVALAKSLERVRVRTADLGVSNVGGLCVKQIGDNGNVYGVITLNERRNPRNQQWDCAHELIHLWFHPPNNEIDPQDVELMRLYDIQANWGAKEIKMPRRLFVETYTKLLKTEPNIEEALSEFFQVGISPVVFRIDELMRAGILAGSSRSIVAPPRRNGVMSGRELNGFIRSQELYWTQVLMGADTSMASSEPSDENVGTGQSILCTSSLGSVESTVMDNGSIGGLVKVTDNGKYVLPRELFAKCPRCGNEIFHPSARYCWMCALPRFNECTRGNPDYDDRFDDACGEYNHAEARYCEMCGAPTVYLKIGFLRPWEELAGPQWTPPSDDFGEFNPDEVPF